MIRLKDRIPTIPDLESRLELNSIHLELSERYEQHLPLPVMTFERKNIIYKFGSIVDLPIIERYGWFKQPDELEKIQEFAIAGIYNATSSRRVMRPAVIVSNEERVLYGAVSSMLAIKYIQHHIVVHPKFRL